MKKLTLLLSLSVVFVACKNKSEESTVSAAKGSGLFKNAFLYSVSDQNNPDDKCWYHYSEFRWNPFDRRPTAQQDEDALKNASPLTQSSVTKDELERLIANELGGNTDAITAAGIIAGGVCTGISVATSSAITANPATGAVIAAIVCPGVSGAVTGTLNNAVLDAKTSRGSVETTSGNGGVKDVDKDGINLIVNSLKNKSGDGAISSCADLKKGFTADFYNELLGRKVATASAGDKTKCSTLVVTADIAKVYSGDSSSSKVLDNGIGKGIVVDVASTYQDNPNRRIYVKPRAGSTYSGQGVWMDLNDLACQ